MLTDYSKIWLAFLSATQNSKATDVLASIHEDALNDFLTTHHSKDSNRYRAVFERTFQEATGKKRKFVLKVEATKPIQLFLPPLSNLPVIAGAWNDLPQQFDPDETPRLSTSKIVVHCPAFELTLRWPKLDGTGDWEWPTGPIAMALEAYLELRMETATGASGEYRFSVYIRPARVVFEDIQALLDKQFSKLKTIGKGTDPGLAKIDEQAFKDLLIIALNIVGTEFAPRVAQSIELPTPVIGKRRVAPTALALGDKVLTIGATIDRLAVQAAVRSESEAWLAAYRSALALDLEEAGGSLEALVVKDERAGDPRGPLIYSDQELGTRLVHSKAVLARLDARAAEFRKYGGKVSLPGISTTKAAKAVRDAMAVGVTEYLFDVLVADALPDPKYSCTDWLTILAVRGRACSWSSIRNPDVTINSNASITGSVFIDFGAKIEACVRKFWDCSWRWECGDIGLGIKGLPTVTFSLKKSSRGVRFGASFSGNLKVDVDLPPPFKQVLEAVLQLIVDFLSAVLSLFAAFVEFQVVPDVITLPDTKTKLEISSPKDFFVARVPTVPVDSKNRLVGFTVTTRAS